LAASLNHAVAQPFDAVRAFTYGCLREAGSCARALRLLDHERWLAQFRADAEALKDEDINAEPQAW
jgi:hypothetical protein